jgi:3',5'-cyclic AMP phosphodiesterase CpdA
MLLAQLTDTHVIDPNRPGAGDDMLADNNARLAAAVARLNAETVRPEAVLATGDMTDTGSVAEMELLAELLAPLDAPILALPGNHDRRETFRDRFDMPWATDDSHLSWTVDVGPLHIVGLDTLLPGSHGGLFDPERQRWLADALEESGDRPTVIAMHHPPFLSGVHWMDTMALDGLDVFAEIVGRRSNVVRILCGHLHRPLTATVAGVTTTVAPSTIHHIELDLAPDAPVAVIDDPAGYHLHHIGMAEPAPAGNAAAADQVRSWVTHIRYIDGDRQPVRPSWST